MSTARPAHSDRLSWYLLGILAIIAGLALSGCAKDRGQQAANQLARHQAITINTTHARAVLTDLSRTMIGTPEHPGTMPPPQAILDALAAITVDLKHVDTLNDSAARSVPAVAEVAPVDIPKPDADHQPATLAAHPEGDRLPPPPAGGWGKVAGIATASALAGLWLIGRLAPLLPLIAPVAAPLSPLIKGAADLAWRVLAHPDQKAADQENATLANSARTVVPMIQAAAGAVPALANILQHPAAQQAAALLTLSDAAPAPALQRIPPVEAPVSESSPTDKG